MSILSALLVLLSAGPVFAPPAAAPAAREQPATQIRTFDVRGVGSEIPNYPLTAEMIPGPDAPVAQPPAENTPAAEDYSSVVKLIETTVDPSSWRDSGGAIGSIAIFQSRLVVTQTPENLTKIQQLLDQLDANPPSTLRVNATWVLLKPEQAQTLRARFSKATDATIILDGNIMPELQVYSRGQTMGFDGQTVHISQVARRRYVSDMQPVVATGISAYSLTMSIATSGVALQVTPHLAAHDMVRLNLLNIVGDVSGISEDHVAVRTDATMPAETAILDRPRFETAQIHTTVQIPLGKEVLIGGTTMNPGGAADGQKELYLVISVNASK